MLRPSPRSPHWGRSASRGVALGLALALGACEQNPLAVPLPGSQWTLTNTVIDSMLVTRVAREPLHGASLTLYAGQSEETDFRESGILIKFSLTATDTSTFGKFIDARLVFIRRLFGDVPPEPFAGFRLRAIVEPDTAWAEADTGLTLADFPQLTYRSQASLVVDTVTVFVGGAATDTIWEHLSFPVDTMLFRSWVTAEKANNGFLMRSLDEEGLTAFYSRGSATFPPYLELTLADTTAEGKDTVVVHYRFPRHDLSIYSWELSPAPAILPLPFDDLSIQLNHSYGLRTILDFSPFFTPDSTQVLAGARLILKPRQEFSGVAASRIVLQLLARLAPASEIDSSKEVIGSFAYSAASDSTVLNMGNFLTPLITGSAQDLGLELAVIPQSNDFDQVTFWGPDAPEELRPRLEIIYTQPYAETP